MENYRGIIKRHQQEYLKKINWRDIKNLLEEKGLMPADCREAQESQRMSVLIEVTLKSNNESDVFDIFTILDGQIMNMKSSSRESPITNDGDEDEYRNNASSRSTSHVKIEEDGSSDGHGWKDEMLKLSRKVETMEKELKEAREEKIISDRKLNKAESRIEEMKGGLKATNERLARQTARYENEKKEKIKNIESLEKENNDTKEELKREQQNNKDKSAKIDSLETKVNDLENDVIVKKQEVQTAKEANDKKYEQEIKQLKEELQKYENDAKKNKSKFCLLM